MSREYSGMGYEQASREAERLITSGGWYRNFDKLRRLREIMETHGDDVDALDGADQDPV